MKEKWGSVVVVVFVNIGGCNQPQTSTSFKGQKNVWRPGGCWEGGRQSLTATTINCSSRNYCCHSFGGSGSGGGGGC